MRRGDRHVIDHDGPDAGKIKAAEKWIYAELAGTSQIDEKLNQQRAQLPQFAWELVNRRQLAAIVFSAEEIDPAFGKRIEQLVESFAKPAGFFFRMARCSWRDPTHQRRMRSRI